mgnify:CR=1 FL=1
MCGHAERKVAKRSEGGEIGLLQGGPVGIDHRQSGVAVGGGAAMARQVLEDRQDAAGQQPLGDGFGDVGDFGNVGTIGPVPDHRVAAGNRNIRDRQAVDVDAERMQIGRDQASGKSGGGDTGGGNTVIKLAVARSRRIGRPMRRPEPLHPAALLVHQHGRFPANDITERTNECLYLGRRAHISLEDDQAPRLGLA